MAFSRSISIIFKFGPQHCFSLIKLLLLIPMYSIFEEFFFLLTIVWTNPSWHDGSFVSQSQLSFIFGKFFGSSGSLWVTKEKKCSLHIRVVHFFIADIIEQLKLLLKSCHWTPEWLTGRGTSTQQQRGGTSQWNPGSILKQTNSRIQNFSYFLENL